MHLLFASDDDLVRGPMARALAQRRAVEMRVFRAAFDSAGIAVAESAPCPPPVLEFLRGQGLDASRHRSKPLTPERARQADVVFAMTRAVADAARRALAPHGLDARVVLANEAIGFGRSAGQMDIAAVPRTHGAMMAAYSVLKATTGRIVRRMADGVATPALFGVEAQEPARGPLADARVRRFVARYLYEILDEAFEPPATEHLLERLEVLGRTLSRRELEELAATEIGPRVVFERSRGLWRIDRTAPPPAFDGGPSRAPLPERRNGAPSVGQAFALLGIRPDTPPEEARRAVRKLLMRYHPDRFQDDEEFRLLAEAKTQRLNAAWRVAKERLDSGQSH